MKEIALMKKAICNHFGLKNSDIGQPKDCYLNEFLILGRMVEIATMKDALTNVLQMANGDISKISFENGMIDYYTIMKGGKYCFCWL
jgi:hypothetical protein